MRNQVTLCSWPPGARHLFHASEPGAHACAIAQDFNAHRGETRSTRGHGSGAWEFQGSSPRTTFSASSTLPEIVLVQGELMGRVVDPLGLLQLRLPSTTRPLTPTSNRETHLVESVSALRSSSESCVLAMAMHQREVDGMSTPTIPALTSCGCDSGITGL